MGGHRDESTETGGPIESSVDLVIVGGVTMGTLLAVWAPELLPSPARVGLGLGFVLFVPGYALVSALFPARRSAGVSLASRVSERERDSRIALGERLVMVGALNVFVVPLAGLFLNYTAFGITVHSVLTTLAGVTVVLVALAWVRRFSLPAAERFGVPITAWIGALSSWLSPDGDGREATLNVLLVVGVVLAASSATLAIAVPGEGERYTEFAVGTTNETTGEFVANDYPTQFVRAESKPLAVSVTNKERRTQNYTVVVELQDIERRGDERTITQTVRVAEFSTRLQHQNSTTREIQVRPAMTGENLRLTLLLYRGSPPTEPGVENAYRHLHLWIDVDGTSAAAEPSNDSQATSTTVYRPIESHSSETRYPHQAITL